MKRLYWLVLLVSAGLLLGTARAEAQEEEEMVEDTAALTEEEPQEPPAGLTMQMGNNWMFTFAGNVNAFGVYTDGRPDEDDDVPDVGTVAGGLVPVEEVFRVRTGLLPAFAVFDAKGRQAGVDLGVHFGFAPQVQTCGVHDNFGNCPGREGGIQAGAQIDMRQVFATVGGEWGQILFGREIGLYLRQNILTDQSLFGVGASGGGVAAGGTSLGRIGFGYIYPNFNAQLTYSTPAGRPFQLAIGLFDPSFIGSSEEEGAYQVTRVPRLESEITYNASFGEANKVLIWANGLYQNAERTLADEPFTEEADDVNGVGVGGGLRLDVAGFSLTGSGYYGEGLGSTLIFTTPLGVDATGQERTSFGYIAQALYTPPGTLWTLGASFGDSRLNQTDADEAAGNDDLLESNRAIIGTVVYQATQALKVVFEYTRAEAESHGNTTFTSDQGAAGLMLFF